MIRMLKFFSLAFVILGLVSCGNIEQDIALNKDGSGQMDFAADLSGAIPMLSMMMAMDTSSTMGEDPMTNMFMDVINGGEIDTVIQFADFGGADSFTMDEKKKLSQAKLNILGKGDEFIVSTNITFSSFKDIDEIFSLIGKAGENASEDPSMAMAGGMGNMFGDMSWDDTHYFTKKFFKQRAMSTPGMGDMGDMGSDEQMDGMMEMMFGSSKFITTYTFPYKVKSVNQENATIVDDYTVRVEKDLIEMMKEENGKDLEVYFKKKFLGIF